MEMTASSISSEWIKGTPVRKELCIGLVATFWLDIADTIVAVLLIIQMLLACRKLRSSEHFTMQSLSCVTLRLMLTGGGIFFQNHLASSIIGHHVRGVRVAAS